MSKQGGVSKPTSSKACLTNVLNYGGHDASNHHDDLVSYYNDASLYHDCN